MAALSSNTYTSILTYDAYDAMVYFDLLDIAGYLQECNWGLVKGGMALFQHSNNHADYKASFANTLHGRNYINKDIFAYLVDKAEFEIVRQEIIDWGTSRELDCLTLVRKLL